MRRQYFQLVVFVFISLIQSMVKADGIDFQLPAKTKFEVLLSSALSFQNEMVNVSLTSGNNNKFIIGGRKASNEEFASVVALVDADGKAFCTGTLIAPDIIATAGHCLLDASQKSSPILNKFKTINTKYGFDQADNFTVNFERFYKQYESKLLSEIHVRIQGKNHFNIVKEVAISNSWQTFSQDMLRQQLFNAREVKISSIEVSDKALIKITQPFNEIPILLLPNKNELMEIHQGKFSQAIQVGYGLREDPNKLKQAASSRKEWKFKMDAAMDEKYLVSLPVNMIYQGVEGFRAGVGKPGRAACFGDSGGPTFVQLQNEQWRFFASLSRGVSGSVGCGESDASIWPEDASEETRQTTEFVDVWLRDEN